MLYNVHITIQKGTSTLQNYMIVHCRLYRVKMPPLVRDPQILVIPEENFNKKKFFLRCRMTSFGFSENLNFFACLEVQRIHSIGSQINALNSPFRREKLAIFLYCFSHSNFPPPFSGRAVAWGGKEASNNVLSGEIEWKNPIPHLLIGLAIY